MDRDVGSYEVIGKLAICNNERNRLRNISVHFLMSDNVQYRIYSCNSRPLYKPTPLFVGHFQVFKVFHNLANPAILSMCYVVWC